MPNKFTVPNFKDLLTFAKELKELYLSERENMDNAKFYVIRLFSPAHSPKRLNDIDFINKFAPCIEANKFNYSAWGNFTADDYNKKVVPVLKESLAGALLLVLSQITKTYADEESVKTRSALGKLILGIFNIDKLSDVPAEQLNRCLDRFNKAIDILTAPQHITYPNEKLKEQILAVKVSCEAPANAVSMSK